MSAQLENPFPGLRPFEMTEHYLFFGRDGQSEELVARLEQNRFVAVVGTSGSGKSSLVRAGLLPALYSGSMASAGSHWKIAVSRPGDDPIGNLARVLSAPTIFGPSHSKSESGSFIDIETTLRRSSLGLIEVVRLARMQSHENLLVVIDQFEELFRFKQTSTTTRQQDEAVAFVKLLLEAFQQSELPIYVVLTMRSDYLGECAQFRDLPEAINKSQYLIPRMTDDERREAITGPVAVSEGRISLPLVNRLLNDAGDNPDQLPILQHALMRTWDRWEQTRSDSEPLDIPHYEEIGGMEKALSMDADKAYGELSESRQKIAEKLFKCLTERGPDNQEIRRPTTVREICEVAEADESEVIAVIDAFRCERRCFLMAHDSATITAQTRIDISHESLIRGWGRLKDWVEEEAQSARQYCKVSDAAQDNEQGKGDLLTGAALQIALDWRDRQKPNAVWAERYRPEFESAMAFLDESKAAREAAIAERERQQKEMVEQKQRLAEIERQQAEERAAQAQALADQKERSVRRLRWLVAAMVVMFLLASGAAVYAFTQRARAKAETQRANEQAAFALYQKRLADAALYDAERQKIAAEAAKTEAVSAKDRAEQATKDLAEATRISEERFKKIGEARLGAIRTLGDLYDEAFDYLKAKDQFDEKQIVTGMQRILEIYTEAGSRRGQITSLVFLKGLSGESGRFPANTIEYNKKIVSLLGDSAKEKSQKASLLEEIGDSSNRYAKDAKQAAQYYEQALALLRSSPSAKRTELQAKLAKAYSESDSPAIKRRAAEYYETAASQLREELQTTKGDGNVIRATLYNRLEDLATVYIDIGEENRAEERLNQAKALYPNRSFDSFDYMKISEKLFDSKNTQKSSEYFEKAVEATSNSQKVSKSEAAISVIQPLLNYASVDKVTWYFNQALKTCRMFNDSKAEATLYRRLGDWHHSSGRSLDAIKLYKAELSVYEAIDDKSGKASALIGIGGTYSTLKSYDEALKHLNQALDIYKLLDNKPQQDFVNGIIKNVEAAKNRKP